MPDIINKLSTYAALIGVIGAIGGGFYAWGEFNTRLNAVEDVTYETTDLSGINKDIKELNEKINNRVNALGAAQEEDYLELLDSQAADHNELVDLIRSLESALESLKGDIGINAATIEYVDAKVEELKVKQSNPLLN
jgi:predicted  nucleic acid-binding Zn-ribbon protein